MSAIDRLPPPALPFGPASFNDHALVMSQGRSLHGSTRASIIDYKSFREHCMLVMANVGTGF